MSLAIVCVLLEFAFYYAEDLITILIALLLPSFNRRPPNAQGSEFKFSEGLSLAENLFPLERLCRNPVHGSRASSRRICLIVNSSAYPFALSPSKGSERIATQSPTGED